MAQNRHASRNAIWIPPRSGTVIPLPDAASAASPRFAFNWDSRVASKAESIVQFSRQYGTSFSTIAEHLKENIRLRGREARCDMLIIAINDLAVQAHGADMLRAEPIAQIKDTDER